MGRKPKKRLRTLTDEQLKQADYALGVTDNIKDAFGRDLCDGRGCSYTDFAPEVVAGLFYARKAGELTIAELSRRCGFPHNLQKEQYLRMLGEHPRWAHLEDLELRSKDTEVEFGGLTLSIQIGRFTTDKAISDIARLNLARLMLSQFDTVALAATRMAIAAGFVTAQPPNPMEGVRVIGDFQQDELAAEGIEGVFSSSFRGRDGLN